MMKRTLLILLSFTILGLEASNNEEKSYGCDGLNPVLGKSTVFIQHEGKNRSYRLYVPKNYEPDSPTPLVINFHGTGSNAEQQAFYSDMDSVADKKGFIHVNPQGLELDGRPVFNAGLTMQSPANKRDFSKAPRDDVDFAKTIVEHISTNYCLNKKKVYSTGMSNGGRMSYRIGCEAADTFAAIAPVAGVLSLPEDKCQPTKSVPSIAFHGTRDFVSSYNKAGGYSTMGALEMFSLWAQKNQCEGTPIITFKKNDVSCESYKSCKGGAEIKFCTIEGGGHCWPGRPCRFGASSTINASEMIMEFLLQFERT
jgi:polyhydroxybutyrate depolymerase